MSRFALYRYKHPDGSSKDWMVQESDAPPLVIYFDKTGSKRYRSHVIDAASMPQGLVSERQNRVDAKVAKGYQYMGSAEVDDDGNVTSWPWQRTLNVSNLYWTTNDNVKIRPDDLLPVLADIAKKIGKKPVLGYTVKIQGDLLIVSPKDGTEWHIGFGVGDSMLNPSTGRGAGMVTPNHCPIAMLVLMAINKKLPNAIIFADESGSEVTLQFKASNPWLIDEVIPLDRQRDLAVKLELCIRPIDYSQMPEVGLGF